MTEPGGRDVLEPYVAVPPPEAPPPRRRPLANVAAALAVAVALVAGVLALAALNDDGSGTPEDAVRRLVAALEAEDLVGALEAVVPAEREVLRERILAFAGELRRLGITADDLDLGRIPGVDVRVDGLELRSEALADDVAAVLVTAGTARLDVSSGSLPAGPLVRRFVEGPEAVGVSSPSPADLARAALRLVAVRTGGRWLVSLGYSMADAIRRQAGIAAPDFDRPVTPRGAASPEEAVRELARAASALDARRLVELAAPGEGDALHAYAPLFLPFLDARAGRLRADGLALEVPVLEVSTERAGGSARVTVDRLTVRFTSDDGAGMVEHDGRCTSFTYAGEEEPYRLCDDDPIYQQVGSSPAPLAFTLVERDGAWYVSVVGSWFDTSLEALRGTDRAEMERAIEQFGSFAVLRFVSLVPFGSFPLLGLPLDRSVVHEQGECVVTSPGADARCQGEEVTVPPAEPSPTRLEAEGHPLAPVPSTAETGAGWSPYPAPPLPPNTTTP